MNMQIISFVEEGKLNWHSRWLTGQAVGQSVGQGCIGVVIEVITRQAVIKQQKNVTASIHDKIAYLNFCM